MKMTEQPEHPFRSTHEFKGFSMWPTLQPGDGLFVAPYSPEAPVAVGDVIVFFDSKQNRYVVHRVVEVGTEIRTQGDNNARVDAEQVQASAIVGKVLRFMRRNKRLYVRHGFAGQWIGRGCRIRRRFCGHLRRVGRPFYDLLVRLEWLPIPLRWLSLQVVRFQRSHGTEMILRAWGRWPIGVVYPERQYMAIKWPFRLVIQRDSLRAIQGLVRQSNIDIS